MKSLAEQLGRYQEYHTQRITRITHFIGVPFILFSLMIFLGWIHIAVPNLFEINMAWIGVISLLIYYYFLDVRLAAGLTVILILMAFMADFFSQPVVTTFGVVFFLVTFLIGVIAQAIGHIYEKKKPAFVDDASQLLIAPMYLMAELMFELGYRKDLQAEIMKYRM